MQISIHIDASSAEEAQQAMIALLAGTSIATGTTTSPSTETGAKRGGRKASSDSKPAEGDAGNGTGAAPTAEASAAATSQSSSGPVTKESLGPRLLQLGQKAGPAAASELLGEFGAKKLSEVPEDKYVAMNARLDDLLAA